MPINVWILVAAQALAMSTAPFIVFIGSIHGRLLAPSPEWATLPVGLVVVGTVLAIKPATWLMERLGRKPVMLLGTLAGVVSGLFGALAAWSASFPFLCAAAVVGGTGLAVVHQYRFAAHNLEVGYAGARILGSDIKSAELFQEAAHGFEQGFGFVLAWIADDDGLAAAEIKVGQRRLAGHSP